MRVLKLPSAFLILPTISLAQQQAEVSLVAVAKNGSPIGPGYSHVFANPGDVILAELRIQEGYECYFEGGLAYYDLVLDGLTGATGDYAGQVLLKGWDAPLEPTPCATNADCVFEPAFHCARSLGLPPICAGPDHQPWVGAKINCDATPIAPCVCFDCDRCEVRGTLAGLRYALVGCFPAQPAMGYESYAGTLILEISEDACGTFVFGFKQDETVLGYEHCEPVHPSLRPLVIEVTSGIDCDANGHPDDCEIQIGAALDWDFNEVPDVCDWDMDADGDVDLLEAAHVFECFGAEGLRAIGPCAAADFTQDYLVSMADYASLHANLTGPR